MTRPPDHLAAKASPEKAANAILAIRPRGLVKLVAIVPDGPLSVKCFLMPEELAAARDWIARNDGAANLHLEPNPPRVRADKRSKESDIAVVVYAYTDCDPVAGELPADAQARHHDRLNSGDVPKPTFEYTSGGGTVGLWLHAKPIKMEGPESIETAKAINIGLARRLGTKAEGFDSCQSVDHLYRIPNTTNLPDRRKRAKGRKTTVAGDLKAYPNRRYERDAFPVGKVDKVTTANDIGDAVSVDLDGLEISDRSRAIIEAGEAEGKRPKDDSPSGWRMSLIHGLKNDGLNDETILGVLLDPDNKVSAERAKKAGSRAAAEVFFRKEIAKATVMRNASVADDFDDDLPVIPDEADTDNMDFDKPAELEFELAPYEPVDATKIPMRQWLYGTSYIRKFIGLTAATGGAGKSSLILVECVAMACGKDLLGVEPAEKLRVLYWNGEDPLEELERRVAGILKHYRLTKADLGERLFIKSGRDMPIRIAEMDGGKAKIAKPMTRAMLQAIRKHRLDVVAIDPFVSSHGVPENDNNAIELVAKKWADIADKTNSSVILSHHTRKTNGTGASIEDSRGASALNYAARTRRAINTMSAAEAKACGITDDRARLSYFKADMMGSSMMKPTASLDWYRFESVDLMNGSPDEDGNPTTGDSVGVVMKWEYKALETVLSAELASDVLDGLKAAKGPWPAAPQSDAWIGNVIADLAGLDPKSEEDRKNIKGQIAEWLDSNVLVRFRGTNAHNRPSPMIGLPGSEFTDDPEDMDFG